MTSSVKKRWYKVHGLDVYKWIVAYFGKNLFLLLDFDIVEYDDSSCTHCYGTKDFGMLINVCFFKRFVSCIIWTWCKKNEITIFFYWQNESILVYKSLKLYFTIRNKFVRYTTMNRSELRIILMMIKTVIWRFQWNALQYEHWPAGGESSKQTAKNQQSCFQAELLRLHHTDGRSYQDYSRGPRPLLALVACLCLVRKDWVGPDVESLLRWCCCRAEVCKRQKQTPANDPIATMIRTTICIF